MSGNVKVAIGAAALLLAWWAWGQSAQASPVASSSSQPDAPAPTPEQCAAPSFPCSWNPSICCTKCSDDPKCSIDQVPGGVITDPAPGSDGPITQPSQLDVSGGPLVSPSDV